MQNKKYINLVISVYYTEEFSVRWIVWGLGNNYYVNIKCMKRENIYNREHLIIYYRLIICSYKSYKYHKFHMHVWKFKICK